MIQIEQAVEILGRTPATLRSVLGQIGAEWFDFTPDPGVWSSRQILTHLINGEITDWIPRTKVILEHGMSRPFEPFNRTGGPEELSLAAALAHFTELRTQNLQTLRQLGVTTASLSTQGMHPDLGVVTLSQLIATWAVHDLGHVGQIVEVLAKRIGDEVGPWKRFLPIVTREPEPSE